jgi:hypothetical protein
MWFSAVLCCMVGKEGYMDDGEKVQGLINSAGAERHGIWTRTGAFSAAGVPPTNRVPCLSLLNRLCKKVWKSRRKVRSYAYFWNSVDVFESWFSVDIASSEKYGECIVEDFSWILYISREIYVCSCVFCFFSCVDKFLCKIWTFYVLLISCTIFFCLSMSSCRLHIEVLMLWV